MERSNQPRPLEQVTAQRFGVCAFRKSAGHEDDTRQRKRQYYENSENEFQEETGRQYFILRLKRHAASVRFGLVPNVILTISIDPQYGAGFEDLYRLVNKHFERYD